MAQYNRLVKIYDRTGKLADVPQSDVVSLQITDLLNGGSGTGEIVFARPYNQIGTIGFGYTVLVWFWQRGTTMPVDPYYGGHIVDFDQEESDASGRVTAHLEGDMKLLDAAIVSGKINPGVSGNRNLDAGEFLASILTTYQPPSFSAAILPAAMFFLAPNQFDATKLGAVVDTITKQGMYPTPPDTTGVLFTWFVRTKANLERRVVVQPDQNPNKAVIAATGARFKHLFRGSQIREYKIQNTYRDIINVVAVYGSQDPQLGTPVLGVYQDQNSIAQFGAQQEKLSVPALQSVAACQAYATTYFALHAYPQAQSTFKVLDPDPAIQAGTWVQIDETPGDGGANAAVVKQIRVAQVTIRMANERVEQEVQTVSPTPYLDAAVYRMGLNVQAQAVTAIKGLAINRQTLFVRSGGYVTATANNPAQVALAPVDAVFPAGTGAQLVSAPAFALAALTDTTGSATNGQTGDGNYTLSVTSAATYVVTRGTPPPNTATQQNLAGAVVVHGVPFTTDIRTLHALPLMPTATQAAGPQAISTLPATPTYPNGSGKTTFDALVSVTLTPEATKSSPWLTKLELLASPHGGTNVTPVLMDRIDPNASGAYAFLFGQLGAGTAWDLWVRYSDGVLSSAPLALATTATNGLVVGFGNVNFGQHPVPAFSFANLTSGTAQNSVHAQVNVALTLTNVPIDGSVTGGFFAYRLHGSNDPLRPLDGIALAQGQPTQSISGFGFEVGAGQNIDVFFGYVGIGSADYGPVVQIGSTAQISGGFLPASLVVTAPYLAGTSAYPTFSTTPSLTPRDATAGVSSTVGASVAVNNQPTDGSLAKLVWWYRKSGDTVWSFAGRTAAVGIRSTTPPASAPYAYDFVDLSNGLVYEFGLSYESVSQAEGPVVSLGTATAPNVVIGSSKLKIMPASVATSGPTMTSQSALLHSGGSGVDLVTFTFTLGETNIADWCSAVVIVMKDVTTGQAVGLPNALAPIASNAGYAGAVAIPAGRTVNIGFAYLDQSGAGSATTYAIPNVVGGAIGTTYLANAAAVNPPALQTYPATYTTVPSANGISAGMRIQFVVTNQPTDGSLYELTLERRVTGTSTVFEKYVDLPAQLGSATGTYDFTALDLSNGQGYDWQIRYRSVQGQVSQPTALGPSPAATVAIPTTALPTMPVGTTVTVSGFNLPASSYTGVGGTTVQVTPSFTIAIAPPAGDNRPFAQWGSGLIYWAKVNNGALDGDTNVLNYTQVGSYNGTALPTSDTLGPLGSGSAYQLAVQPVDQQGIGGPLAIMGLTAVQSVANTTLTGMPASIRTNGPTISSATLGARANKVGMFRSASVAFTQTDFTTKPSWITDIVLTVRMNGDTDGGQQVHIDPGVSSNGHYTKAITTTVGDTIDVGVSYVDNQGTASAIVWPSSLSAQADPDGGAMDPGDGNRSVAHGRQSLTVRAVVGNDGSAPFATKAQNLVTNGDFALYTPPTGLQSTYSHTVRTNDPGMLTPTGWTRNFLQGAEGSLNQYVVPPGQSVPAGPSLVLSDFTSAGGATHAAIGDAFPVKPGAQYVFLADVYPGFQTGLPAGSGWYFRVWFYKPGTTDFSRYTATASAVAFNYTTDAGAATTGTGFADFVPVGASTAGRTYRGVATVPSDAAYCRVLFKHIGTTSQWNLLVQNVRIYEGNIDHATMSPGVQSAIASTGNLLASDFPGQTIHQTTGAYAGWESMAATGFITDTNAYTLAVNQWMWTQFYALNTGGASGQACPGWGPALTDSSGALIVLNYYGGAGVLGFQPSGGALAAPATMSAHRASSDNLAHTFRSGVQNVGGNAWRVVGYVDEIKTVDFTYTPTYTINGVLRPSFRSDAAGYVYIKDYTVESGQQPLEAAHQTLQNRAGIQVMMRGQPPYVDTSGVLQVPAEIMIIRPNGHRTSVLGLSVSLAAAAAANGSGSVFVQWADNTSVTSLVAIGRNAVGAEGVGFQSTAQSPNYEALGSFSNTAPYNFSLYNANNASLDAASYDVMQLNPDGTGNFHAGKARVNTNLPWGAHDPMLQKRGVLTFSNVTTRTDGQFQTMPGVTAMTSTQWQIPYNGGDNSAVLSYEFSASISDAALSYENIFILGNAANTAGYVFERVTAAGQWNLYKYTNPGNVGIPPSVQVAAPPDTNKHRYMVTITNPSGPSVVSLYIDGKLITQAADDKVSYGGAVPQSGAFGLSANSPSYWIVDPETFFVSGGTNAFETQHLTVQNRVGTAYMCSGAQPYVDSSSVLHFPSYTYAVRPSGRVCSVPPGTTLTLSTADHGAVFMLWADDNVVAPIFISRLTTGAAGTGYTATMNSPSYECLGLTNFLPYRDQGLPVAFASRFTDATSANAAQDVIGPNRDGSGNFHAGKARGNTWLPLTNHAQTVQNRNGLHVSVAGKMPYVDSGNALHFPATVIMFRPSGDYCRLAAGTAVTGLTWGSVFLNWVSTGSGTAVCIAYSNTSTTPGVGYAATLASTSYELLGGVNCDISPFAFSPSFDNANTAAASYDVIGLDTTGTGNFDAGRARGGTLLPYGNHDNAMRATVNQSADAFGSYVATGAIHRLHLETSTGASATNMLYNPAFATGFTGSTLAGWGSSTTGAATWWVEPYGPRLGANITASSSYDLLQQSVTTPYNNQAMTLSGMIEVDVFAVSGDFIGVDVIGAGGASLGSYMLGYTNAAGRYPFAFTFNTGSASAVTVRLRVNTGAGGHSQGFFYKMQLEYGTKPSPFVDHMAAQNATKLMDVNGNVSKSTQLKLQGSAIPALNGAVGYSTTTSSVTFSPAANSITWPDGSQSSPGAVTYSGLAAGGSYYFACYFSTLTGSIVPFVQAGGASPSFADEQTLNADNHVGLFKSVLITLPTAGTGGGTGSGGSGGGGGGNSCPAEWEYVTSRERGRIQAKDVQLGMHLLGATDDEWNEVLAVRTDRREIVKVSTSSGESFDVELYHLWMLPDQSWVSTTELHVGQLLHAHGAEHVYVTGVQLLGEGNYRRIHCRNERFRIGNLVGHNIITF